MVMSHGVVVHKLLQPAAPSLKQTLLAVYDDSNDDVDNDDSNNITTNVGIRKSIRSYRPTGYGSLPVGYTGKGTSSKSLKFYDDNNDGNAFVK